MSNISAYFSLYFPCFSLKNQTVLYKVSRYINWNFFNMRPFFHDYKENRMSHIFLRTKKCHDNWKCASETFCAIALVLKISLIFLFLSIKYVEPCIRIMYESVYVFVPILFNELKANILYLYFYSLSIK